MKSLPSVFLILSAVSLLGFASEVKPGEMMADVRVTLGVPRGQARVGDREIFYYDRGEIEAKSGVVTRIALRTAEEQTALEVKRSQEAKRLQEEREIRQARLNSEGEEIKARKLADQSFRAAPLSYQVAFWEDFSGRYPGLVDAGQLLDLRVRLADESLEKRKQAEQAQKLADLEARVAAAENEARIGRAYDYAPYGFARGYSSYGHYLYRTSKDYRSFPSPVANAVTRMYEFPLPYATSPGMPAMQPVYRKDALNEGNLTPVSFSEKAGRNESARSSSARYRQF